MPVVPVTSAVKVLYLSIIQRTASREDDGGFLKLRLINRKNNLEWEDL
ncbi:hypothetical protein COXBURSA331_A1932 [Coxiella burnetii RSA 331]|nr:hypothetical protein COXBURSA331_A1932 [Coxiella burnetii RSA 331]EDR35208.1 hypothetical protein COXBURSA334_0213 [Coxiella burnetii Q321]